MEPIPNPPVPARRSDRPRPASRRGQQRRYILERLSAEAARARSRQRAPAQVESLAEAGRTGSAFRRRLRDAGIDPKLARLVLLFYRRELVRAADVAWALDISPATASRWLDRAEREGLLDKLYGVIDRRGTSARLTTKGVDLRERVEHVLERMPTNERPRGIAWGIRATPSWDP